MALLAESSLAQADGDVEPARRGTDEGCALAERLGDTGSRAFGRYVAGSAELYRGDITGAIATCQDGLAALAPGTYLTIRLNLLLILAIAAGVAGDEQRATAWHKEILAISEPVGECFHRAYALWALGLLALRQDDLDRAAGLQHEALRLRRGLKELTGTGWSLESLSWVEAAAAQPERAAALLGAADRLWEIIGRPVQAYQHLVPYHDACEQTARQALGDEKFQAAWLRGRGLSTDDAIAFALDEKPRAVSARAAGGAALTRREREVAGLVAEGLTNKEIAARLVIAQRTAEGHVERILVKLGFSSRAQLASWFATQSSAQDPPDPPGVSPVREAESG
jgi:non-specific serine/threonine protein kinase